LPLWPEDLFFSYWTECSSAGHSYRKTACVFKNPEHAGMVRRISFQAKSYLLDLQEMFNNLGSGGLFFSYWTECRAHIPKHFMELEKITFRLKIYLSNHTCIFGILKHTSCLSRRVISTAAFSPVATVKNRLYFTRHTFKYTWIRVLYL
jgi:hypothetical protein